MSRGSTMKQGPRTFPMDCNQSTRYWRYRKRIEQFVRKGPQPSGLWHRALVTPVRVSESLWVTQTLVAAAFRVCLAADYCTWTGNAGIMCSSDETVQYKQRWQTSTPAAVEAPPQLCSESLCAGSTSSQIVLWCVDQIRAQVTERMIGTDFYFPHQQGNMQTGKQAKNNVAVSVSETWSLYFDRVNGKQVWADWPECSRAEWIWGVAESVNKLSEWNGMKWDQEVQAVSLSRCVLLLTSCVLVKYHLLLPK